LVRWIRVGHRATGTKRSAAILIGLVLASILGLALGRAILASVLIHQLGWWIGVPVAAGVLWLLVLHRRIGLAHALFRPLALA
jgi:succinate dehydrogenase/fumarate reductase cytochrome b subunit